MENPPMRTLTQSPVLSSLAPRTRKLTTRGATLSASLILLAFMSQCSSYLVRGVAAAESTHNLVCPRGFFLTDD